MSSREEVSPLMDVPFDATLLRIVFSDDSAVNHSATYNEILLKARSMGIAGATVVRGVLGYGPATRDVIPLGGRPVVIEIVDTERKIHEFISNIRAMLEGSLVTLQKVSVLGLGGT